MSDNGEAKARPASDGPICCVSCRHFSYFDNKAGHNSSHALGQCAVESWDGNRGQWALFQHHCKNFAESAVRKE